MKRCTKCGSQNYVKAGYKPLKEGKIQKYKCKDCNRQFTGEEKFHHLSDKEIELIEKMYEEKGEQRKIARVLGIHLRAVQHHFLCLHSL